MDYIQVAPTPPIVYPVSLDEVKSHLKMDTAVTTQDTYIESLIKSCTLWAEKFTGREFITKTFKAYADNFCTEMTLKRAKLQALTSVKYVQDDTLILTTVAPATYYTTLSNEYSMLCLRDGYSWPSDIEAQRQAVLIEFTAGYGTTSASVPEDIRIALLQHISKLYTQRGDCDQVANRGSFVQLLSANCPAESYSVYMMYKIEDL